MKNRKQHGELQQLKRLLHPVPSGLLAKGIAGEVESLMIRLWGHLGGSEAESTTADKLSGRIEEIRWEPPHVTFQIERHGGTVMGSSRAEIHEWIVNLDTAEANCSAGRFRQIRPRNPALDVKPLLETIVREIQAGVISPNLKWFGAERVKVIIGKLVPADCPEQTLLGRRKRFKKVLEPRLAQLGWQRLPGTAPNIYQKTRPYSTVG